MTSSGPDIRRSSLCSGARRCVTARARPGTEPGLAETAGEGSRRSSNVSRRVRVEFLRLYAPLVGVAELAGAAEWCKFENPQRIVIPKRATIARGICCYAAGSTADSSPIELASE